MSKHLLDLDFTIKEFFGVSLLWLIHRHLYRVPVCLGRVFWVRFIPCSIVHNPKAPESDAFMRGQPVLFALPKQLCHDFPRYRHPFSFVTHLFKKKR